MCSPGERLHPSGECLPNGGATQWNTKLLRDDQERATPDCGAVQLARGPQVVCHQQQQKKPAENSVQVGSARDCDEGWPLGGSVHESDGREQNDAFVGGRIEAGAKGKEERRKDQHVSEGNGVEFAQNG
jgi:hypothetical protein